VYAGQVAGPGVPQIHDYNPGIAPSGLFWTIRIPDSAVRVNRNATFATYGLRKVSLFDYPNVEVALLQPPAPQVSASFDMTFKAKGRPFKSRDTTQHFTGIYQLADSRLEWSAVGANFSYQSDPMSTSTTVYGAIGRERNGIFYS
jgi:hypothetical protein